MITKSKIKEIVDRNHLIHTTSYGVNFTTIIIHFDTCDLTYHGSNYKEYLSHEGRHGCDHVSEKQFMRLLKKNVKKHNYE